MAKTGHTKKANLKETLSRGVYVEGAGKIPTKTIVNVLNGENHG